MTMATTIMAITMASSEIKRMQSALLKPQTSVRAIIGMSPTAALDLPGGAC